MAKRTRRIKVKRGQMGLYEENLFGVKAGFYGRTRSRHGKKKRTTFNQLVYDPIAKQAKTVRRFITTWK